MDIIESKGKVGGQIDNKDYYIDSATIKNTIGNNLDIYQQNHIEDIYNILKNEDYNGTEFINKIYLEAFGTNIHLSDNKITDLIINTKIDSNRANTINYHKIILFIKWC